MLKFIQVNKIYPNGFQALQEVTFSIEKGGSAFLTGHSGAGKTTLLKLIIQMERASSGQILIQKKNIERLPKKELPFLRRHIGVIFQDPCLLKERTIFDNVALPLIMAGYTYQETARRVRAALSKVSLQEKETRLPIELSAGEQQRVSIARAIINKPTLLLADEPTGNLDPRLSQEIMQLFLEFNKAGTTLLLATHNMTLVQTKNTRVLTLEKGLLIGDKIIS